MIVKGIIKTINFSENSCTVRLPLFETAAADGEVILDAIISIQPGLYNGYTEGDVVFVDFENNELSQPIVVGKLFLGAEKEAAAGAPSAMTVSNLKVTTQATLPVDTRLSLEGLGNTVPVEKGISSYHSLVDIIKALHQTETSVQQTIKDQSGTVSNIIVEYLSQPVDQAAPTAENTGWNITSPDYKDGFEIWQKTTCYNHRGQALSTEIICLSSIASAVIYKVRCSTRVHAGTNQTEAVKISAWVKLGTELETLDTSANIYYCWSDGKGSALTDWTESNAYEVTLEPAQLKAQNLVIQVKHGAEVYEEETIMYAPLNTPVLQLSNEADVLLYAANGTDCLTATGVCSTATLYVNGDPLEATYVWEWDPRLCTCDHAVDEGGQQLQNTIIVTAVNSTSTPGVVTCKATVTLDGPFKGKVYSKDFTVTQTKIGTSIISQETYYALIHNKHGAGDIQTPSPTGDLIVRDKAGNQLNTRTESHLEEWSLTPPEHTPDTNGWKYWTTVKTTYSTSLDDFEFSTPIINEDLSGVYSLAQGKTTNYYSDEDPAGNATDKSNNTYGTAHSSKKLAIKEGDCWFNTGYTVVPNYTTFELASAYIGKYITVGEEKRKVTPENVSELVSQNKLVPKTTPAYSRGELYQWNGSAWEEISDELVTNKLTANYINALDITAKKIEVLDTEGAPLFEANGLDGQHKVQIGGFTVGSNSITSGNKTDKTLNVGADLSGVYLGTDGISIGTGFKVEAGDDGDTKVTMSKEVLTDLRAVSYWLSSSCIVHTGTKHGKNIIVTAMKKVGGNSESIDDEAHIWWRYSKTDKWVDVGTTLTITTANIQDDNILILATHADANSFNPNNSSINIDTDENIYEREEITFSPLNTPVLDLTNDSGALAYDGNDKITSSDTVSTTAGLYLNGIKLPDDDVAYNWVLTNCHQLDTKDDTTAQDTATVTIKYLDSNTATATCNATYNNESYTKVFTITKQLKGTRGNDSTEPGRSVVSTVKYYKLTNTAPIDINSSYTEENPPTGWSESPETFTAEKKGYNYYETTRTQYDSADINGKFYSWSAPVKNSMLTVDFIESLGITTKKVSVTTKDTPSKTVFEADGLAEKPYVVIGGFNVSDSGIYTEDFGSTYSTAGATETGVYVGTDGIKLGKDFSVDPSGTVYASNLIVSSGNSLEDELSSLEDEIPTSMSELENDTGYVTETGVVSIVDGKVTADYVSGLGCNFSTGQIGAWVFDNGMLRSSTGVYGTFYQSASVTNNSGLSNLVAFTPKPITGYAFTALQANGLFYIIKAGPQFTSDTVTTIPSYAMSSYVASSSGDGEGGITPLTT